MTTDGVGEGEDGLRRLTTDEAVRWLQADVPTVVVVGAGASAPAPACAPGVFPFLDETLQLLHDAAGVPYDRAAKHIQRIWPEVCYGAIGEVIGGDSHLRVWDALAPGVASALGAMPNAVHRMIVRLATGGWPVITTNFDCFIEVAAAEASLEVQSIVPTSTDSLAFEPGRGRVTMLKLHGTADVPSSIRTTAADLARCARIVDRMRITPEPRRAVVIGYSGRDFDLFPWLHRTIADVLWIGRDFPPDHRARTFGGALAWEGDAAELARTFVGGADGPSDLTTEERFHSRARHRVREVLEPVLHPGSGESAAVLLAVLAATGADTPAVALGPALERSFGRRAALVTALLWLAGAETSMDRFREALRTSRRARRLAVRSRSPYGVGRTAIALAYASTARHWLMVPVDGRAAMVTPASLLALAKVLWVTVAYFPLAIVATVGTLRDGGDRQRGFRFLGDYVEHWIRLAALLDRTRRLHTGPIVDALWLFLERFSLRIGYTTGLLNVSKYLTRGTLVRSPEAAALVRATLLGHAIGLSIAHRDAADAILQRGGDLTEAQDHIAHAEAFAREAGSPTLQLKIHALRRKHRLGAAPTAAEVDALLRATSSAPLRRHRQRILEALTSRPSDDPGQRST